MPYALSVMGGDCIGLGIESLGNSEECKKAAASLGKRFEEIENNFAWQKNCYFFARDDEVYWNNHHTGAKNSLGQEICKENGKCFVR